MNAIAAPANPAIQQQLTLHALSCVKDGLEYFKQTFVESPWNAFKAAPYMSPPKLDEMQSSASDTDSLTLIPFLPLLQISRNYRPNVIVLAQQ